MTAAEGTDLVPMRLGRRRPRRLSQLFAQIAEEAKGDISVGAIRDALGDRSFAALLVIFAAFNMIPLPPPASAILGMPLIIVAAQMVYGSKRAWLPRFMTDRAVTAAQFRTVIDRIVPQLVRIERYIRPRYWPFWRKQGDRVIGLVALLMAVIVILPIPLGNWLPAFCTAILGLALTERDGILLVVGSAVGVVALVVVALVIGAAGFATHALFGWMF